MQTGRLFDFFLTGGIFIINFVEFNMNGKRFLRKGKITYNYFIGVTDILGK